MDSIQLPRTVRCYPLGIEREATSAMEEGNTSESLDLLMADVAVTVDRINVARGNVFLYNCAKLGAIYR